MTTTQVLSQNGRHGIEMSQNGTSIRFGAYHRVSQLAGRDPEAESYMTEKAAFEQIDGWAKMRRVTIAKRYLDRDVSGKDMRRPELDRMMADLLEGRIEGVVVAYVDRFSRADVGDALAVVKEIDEAGGQLACLDLGIDPTTEFGEFGLTILLGLARMQWRRLKRSWGTAQKRAIDRGAHIGPTPLGYERRDVNPVTGKPCGPLVPNEDAPFVREMYRRAAGGLHGAVEYLQETVPSRPWTTDSLRKLLRMRAYLGEVKSGDLANRHAHEPLVTLREWEAAQPEPARPKRRSREYPLSGIATCASCKGVLVGTNTGENQRAYGCRNDACTAPVTVKADRLENYCREVMLASWDGQDFTDPDHAPVDVSEAQAGLEDAEEELTAFASDLTARRVLGNQYHAALEARVIARDDAQIAFRDISKRSAPMKRISLEDLTEDATPDQLRQCLSAVFKTIEVRRLRGRPAIKDRVTLIEHGSDEPLTLPEDLESDLLQAVS